MLPFLLITLVGAVLIVRVILIGTGFYKEPLLRSFQRYAQLDDSYNLLPPLLLGMGVFTLGAGYLFAGVITTQYAPFLFAAIFFALAYYAHDRRAWMAQYPDIFLSLPHWYVELRERTTREERRRIAYMWLCLPRSTRLHYNGSDRNFQIWADQVILATISQTVEDQEAALLQLREFV